MNIHITGRHIEVTQGMKDHIFERFEHLEKLFDKIMDAHVVLHIEKGGNEFAECTLHIAHQQPIHAVADTNDLYASIDMMVEKLRVQIQKHKEKMLTERDHGNAE